MVDPRPNETKILEYLDNIIDWNTYEGKLILNLLGYMSDDEVKRFAEIYELIDWKEVIQYDNRGSNISI